MANTIRSDFAKVVDNLSHQLREVYKEYGGNSKAYKTLRKRLEDRGFNISNTKSGGNIPVSKQDFSKERIDDIVARKDEYYQYGRKSQVNKRIDDAMKQAGVPDGVTRKEFEELRAKVVDYISSVNQSFYELLLSHLNKGLRYTHAKALAEKEYGKIVGGDYKQTNLTWDKMVALYNEQIAGKEKQFKKDTLDFMLNKAKMEMDKFERKMEKQKGFLGHNDMLLYEKAKTEYERLMKQKK